GLASLTVRARPSTIWPFIPLMAAWASWSLFISTNPNPFDRPVSRSVMSWARWTLPYGANSSCSWDSVTSNDRFPTYNFLPTVSHLTGPCGPETDGARPEWPGARAGRTNSAPTGCPGGLALGGNTGVTFLGAVRWELRAGRPRVVRSRERRKQ